jgi:hypothetical protein
MGGKYLKYIKELEWEVVNWIYLAQDRENFHVFMHTIIRYQVQ